MQRAIVTGATGAIGTALVEELIRRRVEVLVFCRKGSERNGRIPKHRLVTTKYCSLEQLQDVSNDTGQGYDVFFHLAWEGTTGAARNDMYLQNQNVRYALDAVRAAQRFGCHTFIGAGSQAEYGRAQEILRPDTPVCPETGYGIGKLCAGQMTRELAGQYGMRHIWVRVLSIYGPNDSANSLIMTAIRNLKDGGELRFTKAEQMWDYLYSGEAAEAFYLLGEKGVDQRTYVLGSGKVRPLKEYIMAIRDIVAPGRPVALGDIPYGDRQVMYLCADTSELERDVQWKSTMTFEQGIKNTLQRMYDQ
ncbi:MAG: NAD-dependent epimerase/dehydratase family protein [Acetatifactor muris]|nr:NAD-dependent epimerase/dehydratase family protein [Acetatifactor muris]MCM1526653.1 NAD-dependent epimerase/dehydratase family protein [Bacteroides sp.]